MPGRPTNEPSNYWAFAFQSAKDVEGTTFNFLRHLDGTANEINEDIESVHEGGDGQEVGLRYKTAISMDGQAVANSRPEIGHRLAVACLGGDLVAAPGGLATGASGLANDHLAVPTNLLPYLTIEQYWADQIERTTNCFVTQLDVEYEAGRPLKITPQFIAGGSAYQRDAASALTPTRETGAPFFYPGASISIDGAASAITKITKGKISFKRTVDDQIRTNGLNREDVVGLNFDTEVDFTAKYENRGYYNNAHFGGGSQIPFDLATSSIRLTSYLGAGTAIRRQEFGVNQFHVTGARVNKLDPDGKTMYIDVAGMGYKAATYQGYVRTTIASIAALV